MQHGDRAALIVPIMKADQKTVRNCGDFKRTVNKASSTLDKYPILKVDDLFASLAGGQKFTKLDMNQAYQQLCLDGVVINRSKGFFHYNRLVFSISSDPGIFQRITCTEGLLQGIPKVVAYLDNILITGSTTDEHL